MSTTNIIDQLMFNKCTYCLEKGAKNASRIYINWRDDVNKSYWPKPYQESGINSDKVKAIVIGQDPTIDNPREMRYILEADDKDSRLGKFLREIVDMFPYASLDEFYFTNLVKCRFDEKPGKVNRNISDFLHDLANNCYTRFLQHEIAFFYNAHYIFTLGRDTFSLLARLLDVQHPPLTEFKEFYGTDLSIPKSVIGRGCYLIALPHQPTYDRANKYGVYARDEVARRLANIPSSK